MNIYLPYTRLPSEYQEVEYIGTTGTQYITTSITPNTNTQVEVKIEVTTTAMDKTIFGTNRWSTYYHLTPYSNTWYYWLNGSESHAWTYSNVVWTQYEVVYNNSNSQLSINWTEVWSTSWTTSTNPLEIAKRASDNTKWVFKYFYFNVYNKSTSEYLLKLVPCYRKSDNVIWMYDLVNNQFYTNSWTGTFSKGNDVTMPVLKNIYIGEYKGIVFDFQNNWLSWCTLSWDYTSYSEVESWQWIKFYWPNTSWNMWLVVSLPSSVFWKAIKQLVLDCYYPESWYWRWKWFWCFTSAYNYWFRYSREQNEFGNIWFSDWQTTSQNIGLITGEIKITMNFWDWVISWTVNNTSFSVSNSVANTIRDSFIDWTFRLVMVNRWTTSVSYLRKATIITV